MNPLHLALVAGACALPAMAAEPPLGLPAIPVPADNTQTPEKVALGDKLFHDTRFSTTGKVSCATCHDQGKAFTDSPLKVSEGIEQLTGTRNAPTVINAAFNPTQFWDGREGTLESQSLQPFVNPVEMGLPDHRPILAVVHSDPQYREMFQAAFGRHGQDIGMAEVSMAIAAFERTVVAGDSPFDRWHFGGDDGAVDAAVKRGFAVFLGQGRCASCHTLSQRHALFTDGRFHNLNVGFPRIEGKVGEIVSAYTARARSNDEVDVAVLSDGNVSELGRFAVDGNWQAIGAFKTPTLRNVALTAPYMHDGSLATLEDVVVFYNNGGRVNTDDPPANAHQSSGIRPLDLSDQQQADLVAFLEALTSPDIAQQRANAQ